MSKVTETIFKNKNYLIPMADIQFLEYENNGMSAVVVMKNSQWSNHNIHGYDYWLNPLNISGKDLKDLEQAYCQYRHELDEVNIGSDENE